MPLIGLAIGLVIPTALKLQFGVWEWIDSAQTTTRNPENVLTVQPGVWEWSDIVGIILFGLIGAFFGGLIGWVSGKLQKAFRRE
jgi:H+/Cl- antiporter ClcA